MFRTLRQSASGESANGDLFSCLAQHVRDGRELRFEHGSDDLDLGADRGPDGLGEDRADRHGNP